MTFSFFHSIIMYIYIYTGYQVIHISENTQIHKLYTYLRIRVGKIIKAY